MSVELTALAENLFIKGDDSAARTITIGQTGVFDDVIVIDCGNFGLTSGGALTLSGALLCNAEISAPQGTSGERYGAGAMPSASGAGNTAFGANAGANVTTGNSSVFVGLNAGGGIITADKVVAVGQNSVGASDNDNIVAVGFGSCRYTEGQNLLAIGSNSLAGSASTPHTGQFIVAIGQNTLLNIEGNTWNIVAIGGDSFKSLTTGGGNTGVGKDTGENTTTGENNLYLGNGTGSENITGSSNILLGPNIEATTTSTTGELRIHYAGGSAVPIISADMVSGLVGVNTLTERDGTLSIETDDGDAVPTLTLVQNDDSEEILQIKATSAASVVNPLTSWTTGNSIQGFIKIDINGTTRYLPFYDAPTS
jgi:hypothetical protein